MFKKFIAKLGIGSAKIDLVLSKDRYEIGETIEGEFQVQGGDVEQRINRLSVSFQAEYREDDQTRVQALYLKDISPAFDLAPGERKSFPFQLTLPNALGITRNNTRFFLRTHLDIAEGADSGDYDAIMILPPPRFANVLRAFESLGFREQYGSGECDGFGQEFAFKPTTLFRDQVQEVEFEAKIKDEGIDLLLEVDAYTMLGFGEKEMRRQVFLNNELLGDVNAIAAQLQAWISEVLQDPKSYPPSSKRKKRGYKGARINGALGHFAALRF